MEPDLETEHPSTAGLLSLCLPGTGQLFVRRPVTAALIFAVWAAGWVYHATWLWIPCHLVAGTHAFVVARRERRAPTS